jgi:hypothetical protein
MNFLIRFHLLTYLLFVIIIVVITIISIKIFIIIGTLGMTITINMMKKSMQKLATIVSVIRASEGRLL